MAKVMLTRSLVQSVNCPANQSKLALFDVACRNLVLEVRPSGTKVFALRYVDERGKQRQFKIGNFQDCSLDQARKKAYQLRARITLGKGIDDSSSVLKTVPTVSQFIHERYLPFVISYKRSWTCDRGLLKNHIESIWGTKYLDQITKSDVIELFAEHRKTHAPGSCNRLLILLRYLFACAIKWEIPAIKTNPTAGIPLMKEDNLKERYLNTDEAQRLHAQLQRSENQMLQFIIPMLMLTGARKREVLDARWEDFDFERRNWRIHTTKLGKPRFVPMSDGVINLLSSMPRYECNWVFPNPKTRKPFISIFYSWNTARTKADLQDVRIHDLRHSYASFLVNAGRSLYEVQRLLGHTQIKTTQRYAHLSHDTLLDASNAVTRAVGHLLMSTSSQELMAQT
jgi:integrase